MRHALLLLVGLGLVGWVWPGTEMTRAPRTQPGWALYDRYCVACHGSDGDGLGPASPYTWGRPRALTTGEYRWRSTPVGAAPTDDDLRATIRFGAPGTSMPGFALSDDDVEQLVEVVKAFAPAVFDRSASPAPNVELGAAPPPAAERGAAMWQRAGCVACHGASGAGDGPAARALSPAPYDLRAQPVRRPRASDDPASRRRAIATSIATGLTGTAMPGYGGSVAEGDLWALADHVMAIAIRAERRDRSQLDPAEIAADRTRRIEVGTWPGAPGDPAAAVFGDLVPPQGPVPATLAPAQASLSAQQCARCHAKQHREWQGSIHAAAVSPGLISQIDHALPIASASSCQRCHAPLPEQRADRALRAEAISCAACHVRNWTRHGPVTIAPSLLALPGYPRRPLELYERGDFCLPCHQLPPRSAVNRKPLLNTYKEWLEGPYMRRGVQCQHCHMPNREHTFLGIHDPATFRQGYALAAAAHRKDGAVTVRTELANVGAGHYLPTTPTPAAWLRIELIDDHGAPIAGARAEHQIGRDIYFDGTWHERGDTRIPPGERVVFARAWSRGRTAQAAAARITLEVHPDHYYEGLYRRRLRGKQTVEARALTEQALARALGNRYVAEQRDVPIR